MQSKSLVLMGDFSHSNICCRNNTAKHKQSKRWLESTDDNFLLQVMEGPSKKAVLMNLILTNKEGLVALVKAGATLVTVTIRSWNSVLPAEETGQ